ncbi:hypothetical protein BWI15_34365 [Kribbella sp. ALI-6-A]|uniref:hypothetical protein n=1 Tax=Kribbella sp. ALI-6-A TaxID=1933817 RepID=UPI00097C30E0|nr:hypothetical protein [Kribbella sp. ALI-6-A]ONI68127.1 hypothetical protein BWI15_34365 [Kribbella sp. ALI-6-A]
MRAVLVVAGVLAFLATGCDADDGPDPVPVVAPSTAASAQPRTTTAAPRPTATPTKPAPVRLTVTQARVRYLAVTRPYNVALERFEKAANSGASVKTLKSRARAVAAANLAESRQLSAIAWPAVVDRKMKALARANAAARPHWLKIAASGSLNEMATHLRRATGGTSPAAEIRRQLGLPKYNEDDYS